VNLKSSFTILVEVSTFNVSLLSTDNGIFEVLATAGDTHLAGENFDNRVIDYLVKLYKKKTGTYVTSNQGALGKLKREVDQAKRMLSSQQSTRIKIKSFEDGDEFSTRRHEVVQRTCS
jgi:heat shock protein 5